MRFSLFHLLLILPAWGLAYLLAPTLHAPMVHYRHDVAANDIKAIRLWAINELDAHPDQKFSEYDTAKLWSEMGGNCDPWGNKYQIVELDRRGLFGSTSPFHAYSLGADGRSDSGGNDADDINSWDYDREKHYGRVVAAKFARENLRRTLWLTPIIYVMFLLGLRSFR